VGSINHLALNIPDDKFDQYREKLLSKVDRNQEQV
jgi:hypothetical protein